MTDFRRCDCCSGPLEPAQQLRFLFETDNLNNPAYLVGIRRMPSRRGRPVPVCSPCQKRLESAPPRPPVLKMTPFHAGMLAMGVLSVGWLLQNLFVGQRS